MSLTRYAIVILAVISGLIVWYFAATDFATHSDVFWYGVTTGFLAALLTLCISLIGALMYRLTKK